VYMGRAKAYIPECGILSRFRKIRLILIPQCRKFKNMAALMSLSKDNEW